MAHEIANVGMTVPIRIAEHIITVITSETGERFHLCQAIQLSECKDLARAVILTGGIGLLAVAKCRRRKLIKAVDETHGVIKTDGVRVLPQV